MEDIVHIYSSAVPEVGAAPHITGIGLTFSAAHTQKQNLWRLASLRFHSQTTGTCEGIRDDMNFACRASNRVIRCVHPAFKVILLQQLLKVF